MLASCSKDLTEDVAPSIQGDSRIIASYEADSNVDSRAHLENRAAYWDLGDALGVFAAKASDATNAYFGYDGTAFVGDLQMVKGNDFYAYYPWTSPKALSGTKLTLTIPATQYYNHKYAAGYASFASGMVPAVGIAKEVDKSADVEITLQPVASYIGIPIKGMGKVGSVELKMYLGSEAEAGTAEEVKYETPVTLNGNVTVDLATPDSSQMKNPTEDDETAFTITNPTGSKADNQKITLNCGDGVELSRTDAKRFVFVVPAYIDLSNGVKFEVTVKDMDGKNAQTYYPTYTAAQLAAAGMTSTFRNYYFSLGEASSNIVWNEGGKLLIDTEEQFVKYAYLATFGWKEDFDADEDAAAEKATYFNNEVLRSAILAKDLEFKGDEWFERDLLESEKKGLSAFEAAIYAAYNEGGKNFGIKSIGGALAFNINGNAKSISGLTFNGPVFSDDQKQFPDKSSSAVSDLTLKNTTVKADYFLATSNTVANLTLTNVMVGEGCQLIPATEGQGAFYNTFNTKNGAPKYEVLPKFAESEASIKFANTLTVTNPTNATPFFVTLDDAVAGEGEMNIKTADYNAITTATPGTLYVVAKAADAKALIEKDVIGYTSTTIWHSVVTRDAKGIVTTSYWTGRAATAVNTDDTFTAEELAFVVSKRTTTEATLTCNLTLTYKPWVAATAATTTAISIDGNKKTITGAQIKPAATNLVNYSIFGAEASLKNLTVSNTTIDFGTLNVPATAKVAVLATKPGATVSGVTVGAPTIKIGATSKVETVGGMFAEVSSKTEWDVINGKAGNKITTNTNATKYLLNGAKFGSVVGKLSVAEAGIFTKTVTTDADNKIVGVVDFTGAEEGFNANFLEFGEGQYPDLNTVKPENGNKTFEPKIYVFNGTDANSPDKASFFWDKEVHGWVVLAK